MSNQTKNNNLNYLIDPTFTNVNRIIVLSFENENDRTKFEIKDFDVLIDRKPFFEIPVKNKEEAYEQIIEMSKNNDYTTGNLLDYECFKEHYQLIAIDLSKQIELENPDLKQQINFIFCLPFIIKQFSLCSMKTFSLIKHCKQHLLKYFSFLFFVLLHINLVKPLTYI